MRLFIGVATLAFGAALIWGPLVFAQAESGDYLDHAVWTIPFQLPWVCER